jgi:hypothetical protein
VPDGKPVELDGILSAEFEVRAMQNIPGMVASASVAAIDSP